MNAGDQDLIGSFVNQSLCVLQVPPRDLYVPSAGFQASKADVRFCQYVFVAAGSDRLESVR